MNLVLRILLLIFILSILTASVLSLDIKQPLNFDSQALTTWEFSANINHLPYKDVFYPYGIFNYYYKTNAVLKLIYLLLPISSIAGFYLIIRQIIKNQEYLILATILLSATILFIGIDLFVRYGVFYLFAFFFGQILIRKKVLKKIFFVSGLLSGFTFSFFFDLGVYLSLITIIFIFVREFLFRESFSLSSFISSLILYILGIVIGTIPLILYLSVNNIWSDFIDSFIEIKDFSAYAKTPYLHAFRDWPAIVNLITFFFTLWLLIYKYFVKKERITSLTIGLISLFLVFLFLIQKSIIRSIETSIFFISVLILILIFYDLKVYKKGLFRLALIMVSLIFLINFIGTTTKAYYINNSSKDYLSSYLKVKDKIGNNKIYSYPGDPIFYQIFKQTPPYYFTIYESGPIYAQQENIEYIDKQKINYIIFNLSNWSIQDNVPNNIRVPYLTKFILNNFSPKYKIDNFLILKRNRQEDVFISDSNIDLSSVKQNLLNINLENIPKSEGVYRNKYLLTSSIVLSGETFESLNLGLKEEKVMSNNKLIVIYSKSNKKKTLAINIKSENELKSSVTFINCSQRYPCIINLENIPLFYKNRVIKEISSTNSDYIEKIDLIHSEDTVFW